MPTVLDAINAAGSKPAMTPTQYLKTSPILNAAPDPLWFPNSGTGAGGGQTLAVQDTQQGGGYDPVAAAAAAEAAAKAENQRITQNNFNSGYQNLQDSQTSTLDKWGIGYGAGYRSLYNQILGGQEAIDTMAAKNELNLKRGTQGILGMVGRGIKSAGVMLGNRNAGSSSATDRIAKAYGTLGKNEMGNVGNQYALENMDIANEQTALGRREQEGLTNLEESKQVMLNDIITDTRNQVQSLMTMMQNADLPTQITLQAEIDAVKAEGIAKAQSVEGVWKPKVSGVNARDRQGNMTKAEEMMTAGLDLGKDAFNFTTEAPMAMNGTVPAGANLPIYTLPRKRR